MCTLTLSKLSAAVRRAVPYQLPIITLIIFQVGAFFC